MRDAGPVMAAVAVVVGAATGQAFGGGTGLAAFTFAAAAAGAAWIRAAGPPGLSLTLGFLALACLSAGLMQRALDGLDGPVADAARRGDHVTVPLRLVDDPRGSRFSIRTVARVDQEPGRGSLALVQASGDVAMRLRLLTAGEGAVLTGHLRPLDGMERRYRWRHVTAALDADDLLAVRGAGSLMGGIAQPVRNALLAGDRYLSTGDAALVAGLLVGDDRDLPPEVAADFRAAGLAHLLAVSGANVALMLGLAAPVLLRLSLGARFAAGISLVAVFALVTRAEPSVLRASVMAGLGMLSVLLGRPATGRRILAVAVGGLVLVDPFLIHSTGFRLSCAASAGIVLLAPAIASRLGGPRWMREALAATAAAQIGVAPVALPAFGSLSLVALPANLLVGPAVAALSVYGTASALVTAAVDPLMDGWSRPLALPVTVLAAYVRAVASVAARVTLPVRTTHLLLMAPVAVLGWLARSRRRRGPQEPVPTRDPGRVPGGR